MDNLISLVSPETRFEFLSREDELVKAIEVKAEDGSIRKMLHGVASSTTKDLHGDTILLSALEDMERTAVGMTIFLNHSYELPGDVGGTVTKAIIRQKGVDQNGDPNYQLEFDIEVEDDNPSAVQTWKYIKKGRKLGLSIGAMIPEGGAKRQKDGSYIIEHVLLLETSLVGIPANPKSWVDYAASALRGMVEKATTATLGAPTITLNEGRYKIEGSLDGLDLSLDKGPEFVPEVTHSFIKDELDEAKVAIIRTATTESGMPQVIMLGSWDLTDEEDRLLAVASAGEDVVQKATVWVETRDGDTIVIGDDPATVSDDVEPDVIEAGSCPTCGGSKGSPKGGCSDSYHNTSSAEPDVTDAKIRVIEVDTDEPSSDGGSQGASSSEPDDAGDTYAAPEADLSAEGEPLILEELAESELLKLSINQLRAVALRATTMYVEAKQALDVEKAARIEAERQRDDVTDKAAELVARTKSIIDKVAAAPLPRKAILKGVETEFSSSVEAYYGTAFARALAGKKSKEFSTVDYTELLDLVKGSNETLEQINKQLETLADPKSLVPDPVPESALKGVEDQGTPPQSYLQRQILAARTKMELQEVLRTKSTSQLHMLFGMQLAQRGTGIPFEMWAASGGMAQAIYDGFKTQQNSGLIDAGIGPDLLRALDTGGAAALIRQDLEPFLYELYVREFTAFERFQREPANGLTHTYNQITSFGEAQFMPELGTVTDDTNVYARLTTNVAIVATRRGLSLKSQYAVAAGGMSYNPMDLELQGGLRSISARMQKQIFSGQSSNSGGTTSTEDGEYQPNGFDGLRKILNTARVSNVDPLAGTPEDMKHAMDLVVNEISNAGGPNPSIIWSNPLEKISFDQQQDKLTRIIVPNQVDIGVGVRAQEINVLTGTVPFGLVKGNYVSAYNTTNSDGSFNGGEKVRDMYFLDESTVSLPYLGSEGPTVLDIPIGISGQLTHLFIIFGMWGLAVKALPFSNKLRVKVA